MTSPWMLPGIFSDPAFLACTVVFLLVLQLHLSHHTQIAQPQMRNPFSRFRRARKAPRRMNVNQGEMHNQAQSPLFGKLPPEIRNEIFEMVLPEYQDSDNPYGFNTYYARPGMSGPKRSDVALLSTCKLAYAEANLLPFRDMELSYYLGHWSRSPPEYTPTLMEGTWRGPAIYEQKGNAKFLPEQWAQVKKVRITPQLYAFTAAHVWCLFRDRKNLQPTDVTITLRYTDWWYWENNEPLDFMDLRTNSVEFPASVQRIVMELETREGKKQELEALVRRMVGDKERWSFARQGGSKMMLNEEGAGEWKWQGPAAFSDRNQGEGILRFPHHEDGDSMGYIVKTLTWEPVEDGIPYWRNIWTGERLKSI